MPAGIKTEQTTKLTTRQGTAGDTLPGYDTQQRQERRTGVSMSAPKTWGQAPPHRGSNNARQPPHCHVPQHGRGIAPLPRGGPPATLPDLTPPQNFPGHRRHQHVNDRFLPDKTIDDGDGAGLRLLPGLRHQF